MDETRFFELIDEVRETGQTASADPDQLAETLAELADDEVAGFVEQFALQLVRLNQWRIWGAGYVAQDGMGDDSFHYFRSWIIGAGAAAVSQALLDPDGLVDFFGDDEELENEELEYIGVEILEDRDVEDPRAGIMVDADPSGDRFDEQTVDGDFPRIAAWAASRD